MRGRKEEGWAEYDKLFNKINRVHVVSCVNGVDSRPYASAKLYECRLARGLAAFRPVFRPLPP